MSTGRSSWGPQLVRVSPSRHRLHPVHRPSRLVFVLTRTNAPPPFRLAADDGWTLDARNILVRGLERGSLFGRSPLWPTTHRCVAILAPTAVVRHAGVTVMAEHALRRRLTELEAAA